MMTDRDYMRRALRLAEKARGRTAPNPMVGAVVVSGGEIVGEGWHHRAGEPHAEVLAFRAAGDAARGGTLYVTLEPCCHYGRTPPCTEAVLASGVRRAVIAMADPFPRVSGGGLKILREARLEVECGLLEPEARELNRAYLKAVQSGLPWVTLKMAVSLDGRIATRTGDSRWITGEAARRYVHGLRDGNDAVLTGIGTVRADDPELTARLPRARNPLRVVVDARGELPTESKLVRTACETSTLLITGPDAATEALEALGVQVVRVPLAGSRVELDAALRALVGRGVHSVLVEAGAELAGALLDARLVDEVAWFIAPKLIGGREAPAAVAGLGVERMAEALELHSVRTRRFGPDLGIFGYVTRM